MTDRADRVALVTGASRGAGAGIARALGSYGMTVYVTGRAEVTLARREDGMAPSCRHHPHSRSGSD